MSWNKHETPYGTSWTKTIGTTNVIVKDMRSVYPYLAGGARKCVYVWTSVQIGKSNNPYHALVWQDWTIPAAKAWAEEEYS